MANIELDLAGVEVADSDFVIPEGWYPVRVTDSDVFTSKAGNPTLKLQFTVDSGSAHQGFRLYDYFGLSNDVGLKKIKQLSNAVGLPDKIKDSEMFHGKLLQVKVKTEVDKTGEYDDRSRPTAYKKYTANGADLKGKIDIPKDDLPF